MAELTLTKTRIQAGVWEGMLVAEGPGNIRPEIEVRHMDQSLEGIEITEDGEIDRVWQLRVPIPAALLSEGVQTFVIQDARSGTRLDSFSIVTGQPLEDDIRAEVDLLRAELDLLKRAFRRHCLEVLGEG